MSKQGRESSTSFHCDRYNKHSRLLQRVRGDKVLPRPKLVKKVVLSKNITSQVPENRKTCSMGIITPKPKLSQQKKITKSDVILDSNKYRSKFDYCKKCGDVETTAQETTKRPNDKSNSLLNLSSVHKIIHKTSKLDSKDGLKQYYKNENFQQSTESIPDMCHAKKPSLDTITEQSEKLSNSNNSIFKILSDSSEELGYFNSDDTDNIRNIKDFRSENFFECHSVRSRIDHDIAHDKTHKCVYRFYLNDRLFPVPFNTDFNENIRCMECNLPLRNTENISSINGMIQAKVKLNNKTQDSIVMLPVKEPLIIKERKIGMKSSKDIDSVYFGIIKLNLNGDSIFNRTLPDNSFALKYQKGYKKFGDDLNYEYSNSNNDDVVIV